MLTSKNSCLGNETKRNETQRNAMQRNAVVGPLIYQQGKTLTCLNQDSHTTTAYKRGGYELSM